MEVVKTNNNGELNVKVSGRLDTSTAPQLEAELGDLSSVSKLVFDFKDLEYVSSAGLRVLLASQKAMNGHGEMALSGVNASIMEVFEITGFADIFTVLK